MRSAIVGRILRLSDTLNDQPILQNSSADIAIFGDAFFETEVGSYVVTLTCQDASGVSEMDRSIEASSRASDTDIRVVTDVRDCTGSVLASLTYNASYLAYTTEIVGIGTIVAVTETSTSQSFVQLSDQLVTVRGQGFFTNTTFASSGSWSVEMAGLGCSNLDPLILLSPSNISAEAN